VTARQLPATGCPSRSAEKHSTPLGEPSGVFCVVSTGVDPVTSHFSGERSAD
jgi:hypothetical protein